VSIPPCDRGKKKESYKRGGGGGGGGGGDIRISDYEKGRLRFKRVFIVAKEKK